MAQDIATLKNEEKKGREEEGKKKKEKTKRKDCYWYNTCIIYITYTLSSILNLLYIAIYKLYHFHNIWLYGYYNLVHHNLASLIVLRNEKFY